MIKEMNNSTYEIAMEETEEYQAFFIFLLSFFPKKID